MAQQENVRPCPLGMVNVGGKWKMQILYYLLDGTKRFGELQRLIPEASRQMLTIQLRELEQTQVVHREAYAQMPPKVEYSLTDLGKSLEPVLRQNFAWMEQYCTQMGIDRPWKSNIAENNRQEQQEVSITR